MIVWTLFAALCLSWALAIFLGFQLDKARAKIAWLNARPLSYWEWVHRQRRMMETLKGRLTLDKMADVPTLTLSLSADETITFRRPAPFREGVEL
jgi:hypothetical protein